MSTMPAAFVGHGSPMNALEHNRYTEAWAAFGRRVPRPRAILAISAHWYINATAVTAMADARRRSTTSSASPRSCSPCGTRRRATRSSPSGSSRSSSRPGSGGTSTAGASTTARGRCSSTRSPTPTSRWCSCRSTPASRSTTTSTLGAALAPLRDEGVLDRRQRQRRAQPAALEWGTADAGLRLGPPLRRRRPGADDRRPDEIAALGEHPDYRLAVPTPDHFLPLLYVAGLAAAAGEKADVLVDGYAYGSLSMTGLHRWLNRARPARVATELAEEAVLQRGVVGDVDLGPKTTTPGPKWLGMRISSGICSMPGHSRASSSGSMASSSPAARARSQPCSTRSVLTTLSICAAPSSCPSACRARRGRRPDRRGSPRHRRGRPVGAASGSSSIDGRGDGWRRAQHHVMHVDDVADDLACPPLRARRRARPRWRVDGGDERPEPVGTTPVAIGDLREHAQPDSSRRR